MLNQRYWTPPPTGIEVSGSLGVCFRAVPAWVTPVKGGVSMAVSDCSRLRRVVSRPTISAAKTSLSALAARAPNSRSRSTLPSSAIRRANGVAAPES